MLPDDLHLSGFTSTGDLLSLRACRQLCLGYRSGRIAPGWATLICWLLRQVGP